jgi:large subunit ribosomal protein L29
VSKSVEATKKLRDLSSDELVAALSTNRDELFRLKLGMQTNQVASTAQVTSKRREIARVLTLLRARNLGLESQASEGTPAAAAPAKSSAKSSTKASGAAAAKASKPAKAKAAK